MYKKYRCPLLVIPDRRGLRPLVRVLWDKVGEGGEGGFLAMVQEVMSAVIPLQIVVFATQVAYLLTALLDLSK